MPRPILQVLTYLAGAILLMTPAFINGFPIVYSDTSTYLSSGFELETPFDRPITYGLFLWLTSLNGVSLWMVIAAQCIILSYLVGEFMRLIIHRASFPPGPYLLLMVLLSLCTSAGWTSAQLIADVFTPIMILTMTVLAVGSYTYRTRFGLFFLFLLSCSTHLSHLTLNAILILVLLTLRQSNLFGMKSAVRVKPLLICLGLTGLSIATMGSALAKSKHAFFMGALVEHGIAKKYLDEHCASESYAFCAYKDSLPDNGAAFLWNEDSPFYKLGGWEGTKDEFNAIINSTLTSPKYVALHVRESIKATGDQLTRFGVGDGNGVFSNGSRLHHRIGKYFPHELSTYESSMQNRAQFAWLEHFTTWIQMCMLLSLIILLLNIPFIGQQEQRLGAICVIIAVGVLINAWACGTFANAIPRLGAKMMWLIPAMTIIILIRRTLHPSKNRP